MRFSLTEFRPLADRVWWATAEPDAVNIGVIIGDHGVLVVDTGSTPDQGREIRAAAERLAGQPVTHVAITHGHRDHCLGLAAFADCVTIGHKSAMHWPNQVELQQDAASLGVSEIVVPNRTFAMVDFLDLGNQRVEFVHSGPAHSPSDIVVLVPNADVAFVGDLWEESGPPVFGVDCDARGWPVTLDAVLGAFRETTQIIVGHGQPVDRRWAIAERMKIAAMPALVEWLIARGVAESRAYASAPEWPWDEATVATMLPPLYAQLAPTNRPRNLSIQPVVKQFAPKEIS